MRSAVPRPWAACKTSPCSEESGQASVEAATLLPVTMLVLGMLLQPTLMLYTRAVMQQAAAEGARVLATREPGGVADDEACRAYVRRRLSAVPDLGAFHVGGPDGWEIALSGDASGGEVSVEVEGRMRPLPLVGVLAGLLGEVEDECVVLRVCVRERVRPDWLEGGYGEWVSMWG